MRIARFLFLATAILFQNIFCIYAATAADINFTISEQVGDKEVGENALGKKIYEPVWHDTAYDFNTKTFKLEKSATTKGKALSQTTSFSIKGNGISRHKLYMGDNFIAPAINILYQCRFGQSDIVIVRHEYNYNSINPIKQLSALSGHPVQVSEIIIFLIQDGKILHQNKIIEKDSSYHWKAEVRSIDNSKEAPLN